MPDAEAPMGRDLERASTAFLEFVKGLGLRESEWMQLTNLAFEMGRQMAIESFDRSVQELRRKRA